MEKAFELLKERLASIDDFCKTLQSDEYDQKKKQMGSIVVKLKRLEKVRILKENELLDALFTFKSASINERVSFEKTSYELMIAISPQFEYQVSQKGLYSEIAEMYISYFTYINNINKVEEIKIINQNNIYHNFPFLCMLYKGLVEFSKKLFQEKVKSPTALTLLADDQFTKKDSSILQKKNNNTPDNTLIQFQVDSKLAHLKTAYHKSHFGLTQDQTLIKEPLNENSDHQGITISYQQQQTIHSRGFSTKSSLLKDTNSMRSETPDNHKFSIAPNSANASSNSNFVQRKFQSFRINSDAGICFNISDEKKTFLGHQRFYSCSDKEKFNHYQMSVAPQSTPSQSFNIGGGSTSTFNTFSSTSQLNNNNINQIYNQNTIPHHHSKGTHLDHQNNGEKDIQQANILNGHISALTNIQFQRRTFFRNIKEVIDNVEFISFKRNEMLATYYYKNIISRNSNIAKTIENYRLNANLNKFNKSDNTPNSNQNNNNSNKNTNTNNNNNNNIHLNKPITNLIQKPNQNALILPALSKDISQEIYSTQASKSQGIKIDLVPSQNNKLIESSQTPELETQSILPSIQNIGNKKNQKVSSDTKKKKSGIQQLPSQNQQSLSNPSSQPSNITSTQNIYTHANQKLMSQYQKNKQSLIKQSNQLKQIPQQLQQQTENSEQNQEIKSDNIEQKQSINQDNSNNNSSISIHLIIQTPYIISNSITNNTQQKQILNVQSILNHVEEQKIYSTKETISSDIQQQQSSRNHENDKSEDEQIIIKEDTLKSYEMQNRNSISLNPLNKLDQNQQNCITSSNTLNHDNQTSDSNQINLIQNEKIIADSNNQDNQAEDNNPVQNQLTFVFNEITLNKQETTSQQFLEKSIQSQIKKNKKINQYDSFLEDHSSKEIKSILQEIQEEENTHRELTRETSNNSQTLNPKNYRFSQILSPTISSKSKQRQNQTCNAEQKNSDQAEQRKSESSQNNQQKKNVNDLSSNTDLDNIKPTQQDMNRSIYEKIKMCDELMNNNDQEKQEFKQGSAQKLNTTNNLDKIYLSTPSQKKNSVKIPNGSRLQNQQDGYQKIYNNGKKNISETKEKENIPILSRVKLQNDNNSIENNSQNSIKYTLLDLQQPNLKLIDKNTKILPIKQRQQSTSQQKRRDQINNLFYNNQNGQVLQLQKMQVEQGQEEQEQINNQSKILNLSSSTIEPNSMVQNIPQYHKYSDKLIGKKEQLNIPQQKNDEGQGKQSLANKQIQSSENHTPIQNESLNHSQLNINQNNLLNNNQNTDQNNSNSNSNNKNQNFIIHKNNNENDQFLNNLKGKLRNQKLNSSIEYTDRQKSKNTKSIQQNQNKNQVISMTFQENERSSRVFLDLSIDYNNTPSNLALCYEYTSTKSKQRSNILKGKSPQNNQQINGFNYSKIAAQTTAQNSCLTTVLSNQQNNSLSTTLDIESYQIKSSNLGLNNINSTNNNNQKQHQPFRIPPINQRKPNLNSSDLSISPHTLSQIKNNGNDGQISGQRNIKQQNQSGKHSNFKSKEFYSLFQQIPSESLSSQLSTTYTKMNSSNTSSSQQDNKKILIDTPTSSSSRYGQRRSLRSTQYVSVRSCIQNSKIIHPEISEINQSSIDNQNIPNSNQTSSQPQSSQQSYTQQQEQQQQLLLSNQINKYFQQGSKTAQAGQSRPTSNQLQVLNTDNKTSKQNEHNSAIETNKGNQSIDSISFCDTQIRERNNSSNNQYTTNNNNNNSIKNSAQNSSQVTIQNTPIQQNILPLPKKKENVQTLNKIHHSNNQNLQTIQNNQQNASSTANNNNNTHQEQMNKLIQQQQSKLKVILQDYNLTQKDGQIVQQQSSHKKVSNSIDFKASPKSSKVCILKSSIDYNHKSSEKQQQQIFVLPQNNNDGNDKRNKSFLRFNNIQRQSYEQRPRSINQ